MPKNKILLKEKIKTAMLAGYFIAHAYVGILVWSDFSLFDKKWRVDAILHALFGLWAAVVRIHLAETYRLKKTLLSFFFPRVSPEIGMLGDIFLIGTVGWEIGEFLFDRLRRFDIFSTIPKAQGVIGDTLIDVIITIAPALILFGARAILNRRKIQSP